jgi:hypothetical protein
MAVSLVQFRSVKSLLAFCFSSDKCLKHCVTKDESTMNTFHEWECLARKVFMNVKRRKWRIVTFLRRMAGC